MGVEQSGLTVKELWHSVFPRDTELIAGGAGLERRVEWATSLRARPPAFDAIKGGEIAFIPVSRIRHLDDRLDLAKVMSSLADKGGVAVAVVGDVSVESIEVADRMMLPLLKLPDDVSLTDVQQNSVRHILDRRTQIHEQEQEPRIGSAAVRTTARDDFEGGFVNALVNGAYASDEAIAERGQHLGFAVDSVHVVIAVHSNGDANTLVPAIKKWAEQKAPGSLLAVRTPGICLVIPASASEASKSLAVDLHGACKSAQPQLQITVALGRGRSGAAGVRHSFREADQTMMLSRRIFGGGNVAGFDDLGLHRLLFSLRETPELRGFYETHLGALLEYDRKHNAGLVATLEAYFAAHGSPTEAAASLSLHRNTVLYRLRRIEEIAGISLDDPGARLNLHLGLRVADVL